jgi:SagB-type dehydrogenase family enzyme
MNTLTKLALGLMGQIRPRPPIGEAVAHWTLPAPDPDGGLPLMQALQRRQSQREFADGNLTEQQLSNLLWAAGGVNRPELGGRTTPSAMNAQELRIYAALPRGLFLYEPQAHRLQLVVAHDVRAVTGYQDFVDTAALDLVYVADHTRMKLVPAARREAYAFAAAGAAMQNVYLYCASTQLATVVRAWFDPRALAEAMDLGTDEQLLLTQTVGLPKARSAA